MYHYRILVQVFQPLLELFVLAQIEPAWGYRRRGATDTRKGQHEAPHTVEGCHLRVLRRVAAIHVRTGLDWPTFLNLTIPQSHQQPLLQHLFRSAAQLSPDSPGRGFHVSWTCLTGISPRYSESSPLLVFEDDASSGRPCSRTRRLYTYPTRPRSSQIETRSSKWIVARLEFGRLVADFLRCKGV